MWIAASMAIFVAASLVDYRWVKWGALPVYIAGVGLLVLCKFIGHTHYGAKSWLEFGGVSLQPLATGDPWRHHDHRSGC